MVEESINNIDNFNVKNVTVWIIDDKDKQTMLFSSDY